MPKHSHPKEPWMAVNLSLIFPGVGQYYAGYKFKALCWLAINVLLLFSGIYLMFAPYGNFTLGAGLWAASALVSLANLFDAFNCARAKNPVNFEIYRQEHKDPWLAVFLSFLFPGVGHIYIRQWLLGAVFLMCYLVISGLEKGNLLHGLGFAAFNGLMCYHVYTSAPIRREPTLKPIIFVSVFLTALVFIQTTGPVVAANKILATYRIESDAMAPALQKEDRIVAWKKEPLDLKRGDLVVVKAPDQKKESIKRLVALPGETVEIREGMLYVNGASLGEGFANRKYVSAGEFAKSGEPYSVPDGHVFVLGDHGETSRDSRHWGALPRESIVGEVYKIFWPMERAGLIRQ